MRTEHISISSSDKINLLSNFSTMLEAGIPILEAVDSLLDGAKGSQKIILETLRNDLSQGQNVYLSFAKFPRVFDKVTVHIIRAAEEAGTLEQTLRDVKKDIKKEAEFADKVHSALIYPIFIAVVFSAVLLLMLMFVIPRISSVFLRLKVTLPLPTRVLIIISQTLMENKILVFVVLILVVLSIIFFYKTQKRLLIKVLSSMPFISSLVTQIDLAKFTRSLYLLLTAGIPITSALELCQGIATKDDIQQMIIHCKDIVFSGKKLSEGFKDKKTIVPNMMIKITEAGERSGSLDKSMLDISEYLEYEVSSTLRTVTALIEPAMLVVVGSMIGGMMLAIIAPIYNLISQVAAR